MDAADLAVILEPCLVLRSSIGHISPDIRGRIRRIDQPFAQPRAIVGGGIRHNELADKTEVAVNRDVFLESWLGLSEQSRVVR